MKVYISKYRDHWISPYTMLDYVFWWTDWSKCSRDRRIRSLEEESTYVEHPAWVERWADYLTPISQAIQWILDRVHPEIRYVKIDRWDIVEAIVIILLLIVWGTWWYTRLHP